MSKSLGYIDIAAVKAAVTLEQILEHYGILATLSPSGPNLRGCCPIHKGDNPKQFSVSIDRGMWNCFSECAHGGSNLDFVMKMEDCNPREAAWKLNDWFSLGHETKTNERPQWKRKEEPTKKPSSRPTETEQKGEAKANPKPNAQPPAERMETEETGENIVLKFTLENLDATHLYLAERGLTAETITHFGIGYCKAGIMAGRIAIPIHNADGQVVGNAGRWPGEPWDGKEHYRLPGKFKKTLEVFNYHRAALEPDTLSLVIVEGFFPVMHLWQHGIRRVVTLMGWHMSERQEAMIAKLVTPESKIILMLDNDEAGITATKQIAARLAEHCFVRSFKWPSGVCQPDEMTGEHLSELTGLAK